MSRKSLFSAFASFAVIGVLLQGAPAMAANPQHFENAAKRNGFQLSYHGTDTAEAAFVVQFGDNLWTVTNKGAINGHHKYQMQAYYAPKKGCLDSHGNNAGGSVWVQPCNTGDYQLWEDFRVTSGSESLIVWKNLGSYTGQGRNLCLSMTNTGHNQESAVLKTCNTADSWQRWF